MARTMTGADLMGGGMGMATPARGGPSGADLARGPMPDEMGPAGEGGGGELDQAIQAVIAAARSVGFELPAQEVPPEQMADVYAQLIGAATQSEMGRSPAGQQMIAQLAQTLGLPSPFGQQGEGVEPSMMGAPPGGTPPPASGAPPRY